METNPPIATIIIDDDKESIFALQSYLELMPEIDLKGVATGYQKAIKLIREAEPELIFLDIEMPGKTGFELLLEIEKQGISRNFKVIFHTAYDKYTIRALREAAFDFLLKPPKELELKEAVRRFLAQRNQPVVAKAQNPGKILNQMVALPTNKGLQFFPKADIVCVECQKTNLGIRSTWVVLLNNRQTIRLRPNSNASSIINHLGSDHFIPLSQSVIVNISYISMVEYKTNCCYLFPPFDEKPVKISRQYMAVLRERFDVI